MRLLPRTVVSLRDKYALIETACNFSENTFQGTSLRFKASDEDKLHLMLYILLKSLSHFDWSTSHFFMGRKTSSKRETIFRTMRNPLGISCTSIEAILKEQSGWLEQWRHIKKS